MEDIMKILKPLLKILLTVMWLSPLYAEKNSVVIGMQLEPHNLDPPVELQLQ